MDWEILVDDICVWIVGKIIGYIFFSILESLNLVKINILFGKKSMYFMKFYSLEFGFWIDVYFYKFDDFVLGDRIEGFSIILDQMQIILVKLLWVVIVFFCYFFLEKVL